MAGTLLYFPEGRAYVVVLLPEQSMTEPENHTLRLLREFREEFREFATKTDRSFAQIQERFNMLATAEKPSSTNC
jgi:hypothetical protein